MKDIKIVTYQVSRPTVRGGLRKVFKVLDFSRNKQGQNITKEVVKLCCPRAWVFEKGYTVYSKSKFEKIYQYIINQK